MIFFILDLYLIANRLLRRLTTAVRFYSLGRIHKRTGRCNPSGTVNAGEYPCQ
nr:MAG TPA: hypothetical protein [Caudoviricetes sp.]